jgi:hypothetical protein
MDSSFFWDTVGARSKKVLYVGIVLGILITRYY